MAKLITKMLLMVGVVFGISNYFLYLSTGKTPFSKASLSLPSLADGKSKLDSLSKSGKKLVKGDIQKAYKWTDSEGVVHYSSEAPAPEQAVEILHVNPNTNLIRGARPAPKDNTESTPTPTNDTVLPQGQVYNPKNVKKLIDDAKNVQKLMDQRYQQTEQALKDR